MMQAGGRRIPTARGALLVDAAGVGHLLESAGEALFEPRFWAARGELDAVEAGRGSAWFITSHSARWVLRHYRRGGVAARWSVDRYLWAGESRVRAFAEWRLLEVLRRRGLPVPKPIAARYRRSGWCYRCDLITERIAEARPLSAVLAAAPLDQSIWRDVGAAVARLHREGVDHADLNAHNILLDPRGAVTVIDFDRSRLRRGGAWTGANLRRLRRSLAKIAAPLPSGRFSGETWEWLLAGYAARGP